MNFPDPCRPKQSAWLGETIVFWFLFKMPAVCSSLCSPQQSLLPPHFCSLSNTDSICGRELVDKVKSIRNQHVAAWNKMDLYFFNIKMGMSSNHSFTEHSPIVYRRNLFWRSIFTSRFVPLLCFLKLNLLDSSSF